MLHLHLLHIVTPHLQKVAVCTGSERRSLSLIRTLAPHFSASDNDPDVGAPTFAGRAIPGGKALHGSKTNGSDDSFKSKQKEPRSHELRVNRGTTTPSGCTHPCLHRTSHTHHQASLLPSIMTAALVSPASLRAALLPLPTLYSLATL